MATLWAANLPDSTSRLPHEVPPTVYCAGEAAAFVAIEVFE